MIWHFNDWWVGFIVAQLERSNQRLKLRTLFLTFKKNQPTPYSFLLLRRVAICRCWIERGERASSSNVVLLQGESKMTPAQNSPRRLSYQWSHHWLSATSIFSRSRATAIKPILPDRQFTTALTTLALLHPLSSVETNTNW